MNPTIQQYNRLAMHYRVLLLEKESVFIAYFLSLEVTTTLYFYNHFYIELIVDNVSNDIIDICAFENLEILDKYIEDLKLEDLMPA
jgi:hypothetical protein